MPSPAVLSVDLSALARNFHTLQALTGAPVHPVVKADSYGLGANACATRLMAEGARTFFVARAAEGAALRTTLGSEAVIYVLDGCHDGAAAQLKAADLRPVLNQPRQLRAWREAGGGACGLQIDTGMNRLGFRPEDAPEAFDDLTLVMSHLACADEPGQPMNRRQREAFAAAAERYPGVIRSFANSGGCFLGRDYAFDAVRPGICLYGGGPEGRPDARIAAVATLSAEVLQVRDVPVGESVGYGASWVAQRPSRIGTVSCGYADGYPRTAPSGTSVVIHGQRVPLAGRVSMDMLAVDLTDLPQAQLGDAVELWGAQMPIDELAQACGTIGYELLTKVTGRVPRRYIG